MEASLSWFTARRSSFTEPSSEILRIDFGSARIELLKGNMLRKQVSGYSVTLQTVLIDSSTSGERLAISGDGSRLMGTLIRRPMVMVMAVKETAKMTDLRMIIGRRKGLLIHGVEFAIALLDIEGVHPNEENGRRVTQDFSS
ncbi:hypothetical protein SAY86_006962 [Trapa natans]|uniref:Uncharacterized protein n=1 Tax=Trapa natans TaxID=22666 RepID=A0AAN7QTQ1_TRANT|nr:hypothetical protein SAY86_006962 [Trapa natans]